MRDKISTVVCALFESVKYSIESFTLPTGKYLLPSLLYGSIIFVVCLVSSLLGFPTLISWQGALLGVIVLLIILIIERSERSEVSAFYRTATDSVKVVMQRAKELGKGRPTGNSPTVVTSDTEGFGGDTVPEQCCNDDSNNDE